MKYNKPKLLHYRIAQAVCGLVSVMFFKRKTLRNEIKGKKGAFVVIANHEAALDFVNLIGATSTPMSFVISNCFYNTLPIKGFLGKMGVIPKQQFQTNPADLKKIKTAIEQGVPIVIYPAGLMCEDGLSTPIPTATYKFLKWLNADVYVARTRGTYFVMPKWAKGLRAGRTYIDIYKLFSKQELADADINTVKEITDGALLFDAYREQEEDMVKYKNNGNVAGLENVLYMCPHCKTEFSVQLKGKDTLCCSQCGFEQKSDEYAFFHNVSGVGEEIRYVSDWSRLIYGHLKQKIINGEETVLTSRAKIHMIDYKKNKFFEVGHGTVSLSERGFSIVGEVNGESADISISIANVPSLPFSPGKYLEIQNGQDIYRCYPDNGSVVMKYINMVKIFHELKTATEVPPCLSQG